MTNDEIFKRISQLTGLSTQSLIQFCSLNMINATSLNNFYTKNSKLPSVEQCAKIRTGQIKLN